MDADEKRLEERKLKLERWKLGFTAIGAPIAAAAIVVPLWFQATAERDRADAAALAVLAQTGSTDECQRLAAFEVTESVWSNIDSTGTPTLYSGTFDPEAFCAEWFSGRPPAIQVQRELVDQLASHPDQWREISAMWEALYPNQSWISDVVAAFLHAQADAQ